MFCVLTTKSESSKSRSKAQRSNSRSHKIKGKLAGRPLSEVNVNQLFWSRFKISWLLEIDCCAETTCAVLSTTLSRDDVFWSLTQQPLRDSNWSNQVRPRFWLDVSQICWTVGGSIAFVKFNLLQISFCKFNFFSIYWHDNYCNKQQRKREQRI